MVDRTAVGRVGPEFEMVIERGKIREFARATFSEHEEYLNAPAPVCEPTFLTTMIFWQGDDVSPWSAVNMNQERGLHAAQEFVFFGPPPAAGSTLRARSTITDIYEKEGKRGGLLTFVVMTTDFRLDDGTLVAQSILTGVETARPPEGES